MRINRLVWCALTALFLSNVGYAQNLITNPSFESATISPWVASGYPGAWTTTNYGGAGYPGPHTGTFYADNGCVGAGCIAADSSPTGGWMYQDIPTTPGTSYTLTFYYAPGTGSGGAELQVLWGPTSTPLTTGGAGTCTGSCFYSNTTIGSLAYTLVTRTVVATATSMRLEFLGRQDPTESALDDVSLVAVVVPVTGITGIPALGTFGMLILACGLLCFGLKAVRRA